MKPLISIIIPVYNIEKYLRECIESVISQIYENLEIILVNDGSSDNSLKIIDEYQEKDDRIILVDKKNGGVSSARNAALKICEGEYIMFIDGDDWVDRNIVELLYNKLIESGADIAQCSYIEEYVNVSKKKIVSAEAEVYISDDIYPFMMESELACWGKLYSRKLFDNVRFPKYRIGEDAYIVPMICERADKLVFVLESCYHYRQRNSSAYNNFDDRFFDEIAVLDYLKRAAHEKNPKAIYIAERNLYARYIYLIYGLYSTGKHKEKLTEYIYIIKNNFKLILKNKKINFINKTYAALICINIRLYVLLKKLVLKSKSSNVFFD